MSAGGRLVLIVEDDPRSAKLARDLIELRGHAVLTAGTVAEGVALATGTTVKIEHQIGPRDFNINHTLNSVLLEELTAAGAAECGYYVRRATGAPRSEERGAGLERTEKGLFACVQRTDPWRAGRTD